MPVSPQCRVHHSKKNKKSHQLIAMIVNHPARIIEMMMGLWIGYMIFSVSMEWGGDLVAGAGLVKTLWMTIVLLCLQAVWWLLHRDVVRIRRAILVPLLCLLLIVIQSFLIPATAWRSELVGISALAAFCVLWVVSCSIRSRLGIWSMVTAIGLALLGILVIGVYHYFVRPDWAPELIHFNRMEHAGMLGAFLNPVHFAAVFLLFFPFFVIGASMTRFVGYARIALGAMGLFSIYAILMSGSWGVLSVLCLELFLIPLCISPKPLIRFKFWFYGFALLLTCGTFAVNTNFTIRSKVIPSYQAAPLPFESSELLQGIESWKSAPIFGLGLRSFDLKNGGLSARGITARLAEMGGVVFFLVFSLVGMWLLFTWRRWSKLPFVLKNHEAEYRRENERELSAQSSAVRLEKTENTVPRENRRKRRHRKKKKAFGLPRTSSAKIISGSFLIGVIAIVVLAMIENLENAGLLLILMAVAFAMTESSLDGVEWVDRSRSSLWTIGMLTSGVFGVILLSRNIPEASAQHFYFMGEDTLTEVRKNPENSFLNPTPVYAAQGWVDKALGKNQQHGDAIRLKGEAILYETAVARKPNREIGQDALFWANRGLEIGADQWHYFLIKAEALELVQAETELIRNTYETALSLAPNAKEVYLHYLTFLIDSRQDDLLARAEALLEVAAARFSSDPELETLRVRLKL